MAQFFRPGIYENLVFSKDTNINDKGTLELHMKSAEAEDSVLDAWESNDVADSTAGKFLIFKPMMYSTPKGSTAKVPKTSKELSIELQQLRKMLLHYAMLLGPKEAAEKAFGGSQAFINAGVTKENIKSSLDRLTDEKFFQKVYEGLCSGFVKYIKGVKKFDEITFRHKFHRKSAAEAFAVLPKSNFRLGFESMQVPKASTGIGWDEWELKNKKNNAEPASADIENKKVDQAESLFDTKEDKNVESTGTDAKSLI